MKAVICKVGNEHYALDIGHVVSIERMGQIRTIPEAAYYIAGLMELRNEILMIIDFRLWLGLPNNSKNEDHEERIIIIEKDNKKIGLIVDAATDVIDIDEDTFQKLDTNEKGIEYVVKVHDKLMLIFDVKEGAKSF